MQGFLFLQAFDPFYSVMSILSGSNDSFFLLRQALKWELMWLKTDVLYIKNKDSSPQTVNPPKMLENQECEK